MKIKNQIQIHLDNAMQSYQWNLSGENQITKSDILDYQILPLLNLPRNFEQILTNNFSDDEIKKIDEYLCKLENYIYRNNKAIKSQFGGVISPISYQLGETVVNNLTLLFYNLEKYLSKNNNNLDKSSYKGIQLIRTLINHPNGLVHKFKLTDKMTFPEGSKLLRIESSNQICHNITFIIEIPYKSEIPFPITAKWLVGQINNCLKYHFERLNNINNKKGE